MAWHCGGSPRRAGHSGAARRQPPRVGEDHLELSIDQILKTTSDLPSVDAATADGTARCEQRDADRSASSADPSASTDPSVDRSEHCEPTRPAPRTNQHKPQASPLHASKHARQGSRAPPLEAVQPALSEENNGRYDAARDPARV